MKKRIISLVLTLCLAACFAAMPISAHAAGNGRAIQPGRGCVEDGHLLSFGINGDKWRVVDADKTNVCTPGMFLWSNVMQGRGDFNDKDSNDWQGSSAQTWCKNFYSTNFSPAEQALILSVSKNDPEYHYKGKYQGICGPSSLNNEKVFFLSAQETVDYPAAFTGKTHIIGSSHLWTRSPSYQTDNDGAAFTWTAHFSGTYLVAFGIRYDWAFFPAFNLDPSSALFTSAAVGGKSVSTGVSEIPAYSGTEWKFTLYDVNRVGFTAETTANNAGVLTVEYSGAVGGGSNYISAMIVDSTGAYTHYGKLAPASSSGSVTVDISGIDMSGKTLCIFNETDNGDKMTDFSSNLVKVDIPASVSPAGSGSADANPYCVPSTGSSRYTGLMLTLAFASAAVLFFSLRRRKEA